MSSRLCRALAVHASVAVLGIAPVAPAEAVPVDPNPAPTTSATLLNLSEDYSETSDMLIGEAVRLIDQTKPGRRIDHFGYMFDRPEVADALIAAHQRGVVVHLTLDKVARGPQSEKVAKVLGGTRGAGSFVYYVDQSGFTGRSGHYLHGKATTFSETGGHKCVILVSSANYAWTNTRSSANATEEYENCTLYAGATKFAEDITADQRRPTYLRKVSAGGVTLWMGPGQPQAVYSSLRRLSYHKGARVDIAMWQISNARRQVKIAERLRTLAGAGVQVSVVINYIPTKNLYGRGVAKALLKKGPGGRPSPVKITNARITGVGSAIYVHEKVVAINDGRGHTEVWSGSKNMNNNKNADILSRNTSRLVWDEYQSHLSRLVEIGSPFQVLPTYTATASSAGEEWDTDE